MSLPKIMKAIELDGYGSAEVMRMTNCAVPTPALTEVLIKVHYAGVNRPDVLQRAGLYNAPPGANPRLGLEVSGEIVSCGEKVKKWKLGDLVTALVPGGGYSEYVLTNENHALRIPKVLDMNQAAALCETFFTVWENVFLRGKLRAGERFLVHGGSSGIGTTAIQLAKSWGAKVYTTAGSSDKCSRCESLGASHAVNYKTDDFVKVLKEKTDNEGMDLILDMVGGPYTCRNISIMANDGRLVFIGFLGGHQATVNFTKVMIKRLSITGSTLRPQSDEKKRKIASDLLKEVWPLLDEGLVRPIMDSTYNLEDVVKAHQRLERSRHVGKITLKVIE